MKIQCLMRSRALNGVEQELIRFELENLSFLHNLYVYYLSKSQVLTLR